MLGRKFESRLNSRTYHILDSDGEVDETGCEITEQQGHQRLHCEERGGQRSSVNYAWKGAKDRGINLGTEPRNEKKSRFGLERPT